MAEGNGRAWSSEVKDLGDKIATLTVTKAVELSEYMEEVHKIKPAAAGVAVMPGGGGGAAAVAEKPAEKTELRHGGGPAERFRRSLSVDRRTVTLSKRRKQRATRQRSPLPTVDRGSDAAPSR